MVKQINHIGINVSDINRSMTFYQKYLGAKFVRGMYNPIVKKMIVYMQIDHLLLELMTPQEPGPDDSYGIIHIAFAVNDHEKEAARIHNLGYSFITEPRTAGSGSGRTCFFQAPGNISVEFLERSEDFTIDWTPSSGIMGSPYVTINSDDLEHSCAFFREASTMIELPITKEASYFTLNSTNLLLRAKPDASSVYDSIALLCSHLDSKRKELDAEGIPVQEAQVNGLLRYYISDPDGVRYELLS